MWFFIKRNYREVSEEIVIEDNITKNIHRDLDPAVVEFRIDSEPSHAKVWLNSENMGYTPMILTKCQEFILSGLQNPAIKIMLTKFEYKKERLSN